MQSLSYINISRTQEPHANDHCTGQHRYGTFLLQQEASHFHCTVLENVLSPALLYNPLDPVPTVLHLASLLQPCGFFDETLLRQPI